MKYLEPKDIQEIITLLKKDSVGNINLINFIEGNTVNKIQREGNSVLIRGSSDRDWVCFSSNKKTELNKLLKQLTPEDENFFAVDDWMLPLITKNRKIIWKISTIQYILPADTVITPPQYPVVSLTEGDAEWIFQHSDYQDYISIEYIKDRINKDVSAGIIEDKQLVAWGMTQDDGAIGFLHVLDDYRRRGYARNVALALIQKLRTAGKLPFAYIEEENVQSTNLFLKLGFERDKTIHWLRAKYL